MNVVVMDAQGGGMGKLVIEELKRRLPGQPVIAVGANALATSSMLRAGADQGATGENAVAVCAAKADVIICPLGMVLCNAMLGEVTAVMAQAIGSSDAHKILIPMGRCQATVAGTPRMTMAEAVAAAIEEAVARIGA